MTEPRSPYDASRPPPMRVSLIPDEAAQERWINEALRFMLEEYGRPLHFETEEQRDGWHTRFGAICHFLFWERGQ